MIYFIWGFTLVALIFSCIKSKEKTIASLKNSLRSLKGLSSGILGMVTLVGLVLAVIPKESLTYIFTQDGLVGFVMVSLIGAIMTIPGPIAFPLAGALLKVGASEAMLASFITTLTMVGILTAPMEISYFGRRFTFLRQALSFLSAILIGMLMGMIL